MPITVKPTQADLAIAREVVRYTNELTEKAAPGARTNICSRPLRLAGGCGAAGVQRVKGRPATICWSRPLRLQRCRICLNWYSTKGDPIG